MCYCIIVYTFRYKDLYIGRSPVDQCVHVLLNKYVLHQHIKLLFLKTSNYALQSQILFSTYLKVHVYHIMELFIYAFKFQFIVKI